jgi:hypothetical protein
MGKMTGELVETGNVRKPFKVVILDDGQIVHERSVETEHEGRELLLRAFSDPDE